MIFLGIIGFLTSCDAMLFLSYNVKNETRKTIKLKVSDYPENTYFVKKTDTIIELKPEQSITVGWDHAIGFPWETKKIYRKKPWKQNFKILSGDSIIPVDSRDKYWKYKHRTSLLVIK
jgi:hypothetical protein